MLTAAWTTINNVFKRRVYNHGHKLWIMNCRQPNKRASKRKFEFQFVPPHMHRANKEERAIQTFKNYLKAVLASLGLDFLVNKWDRLITQVVLTLNLL